MLTDTQARQNKRRMLRWALALSALWAGCIALVYYWRVFYSYGQYPFAHIPALPLTLLLMGLCTVGVCIAFVLCRFVHSFSKQAAAAIFCVGLLFVFVSPPLQVPDETQHFLRASAISEGHFDFDASRGYAKDTDATVQAFYNAWTNRHDGSPVKARSATGNVDIAPQDAVKGECITEQFVDYYNITHGTTPLEAARRNTEPVLFVVLPLLPQALGIALARLLGFGGLGTLYGARIAALSVYALLCYAALKNCRRYRALFCAMMLLPLSLYMAASCSYDSMMLGLYFFAASYFCKDEVTDRDIVWFALALALMTSVKLNNILWLALPLVLPKAAWKTRFKKWQAAVLVLGVFGALYLGITLFNSVAIRGYGEIGRMIEGASTAGQLTFMLQNPLRTLATFWGTLCENDFFLSKLGLFGNVDTPVAAVNLLSPLVLALSAALSVHKKSSLSLRSSLGMLGLAAVYTASNLAGLYVTYTPVGMVRVIGLQARYFLPVYLMLFLLLAGLLSHVLEPGDEGRGTLRARNLGFGVAVGFGILGALLLFATYFVGPVAIVPFAA
ncbi:MAG: DUF2142 domain-containing protein [Ruthenibacterium sp.]